MIRFDETYLNTPDGARLFVRQMGEGRPLIMIHGAMVDADFFLDCAKCLSANFRVICYDRRGYSRSSCPKNYSLCAQTNDARLLLNHFCSEPAFLVGCSAGGLIALRLAAERHPLIAHTLLYEAPIICTTQLTEEERQSFQAIEKRIALGKTERAIREFITMTGPPDPRAKPLSEELLERQWRNGSVFINHEIIEHFSQTAEGMGLESLRGSDSITVGLGDSGQKSYCYRASEALAEKYCLPHVFFPGGHNAANELPMEFALMLTGLFSGMC